MKLSTASYGVPKRNSQQSSPPLKVSAGRLAIHPCGEMQGILAKANKRDVASSREIPHVMICNGCYSAFCGPKNPGHVVRSIGDSGCFRHFSQVQHLFENHCRRRAQGQR
jgi:hypothetical protein